MTGPYVLLDAELRDGLVWLRLDNHGDEAAHDVSVEFSRRLMGLGGTVEVSALEVFSDLGLLAPGRSHAVVLERADEHLRRRESNEFTAVVTFHDDEGRTHRTKVRHNLDVFREYPTVPGWATLPTPSGRQPPAGRGRVSR